MSKLEEKIRVTEQSPLKWAERLGSHPDRRSPDDEGVEEAAHLLPRRADPANAGAAPTAPNGIDPRWESWKQKLPGKPAEMIDLLLLHKSMSTKALMSAMSCSKDSVYTAARKLNGAGLLATSQPYVLRQLE
jgi:hypothetical protein